jgi:DNA-binding MarR family transcriptional regulator
MPLDAVRERMLSALHAAGMTDLSPAHFPILRYPGPDGLRPVEIAAQTGISKQALNYLLGQLEGSGYLHRVADPEDQRSKRVRMTDRGFDAGRTIRAAVTEVEEEFARACGSEDLEALRTLLTRLNDVLGADRLPQGQPRQR